jgi:hypothetical protein
VGAGGGGKGKKRTLVVGGVKEHEVFAYEAVKRWCEVRISPSLVTHTLTSLTNQAHGEVRTFSRKPNGDIHVDFRKSSVAETVCRVRGNVALDGANVHLSWFSGKKGGR